MDMNSTSGATEEEKIEMSKESHISLLNKVAKMKVEERDIALDRYRRVDDDMETKEEVFTLSKTAISFLQAASNASNTLNDLTKEMGKILYKTDQPSFVNNVGGSDNETKRAISEEIQKLIKERRKKKNSNNDEEKSENED